RLPADGYVCADSKTDGFEMHRTTTLCGRDLAGVSHVCAFVESREQQYDLLLPFLTEGHLLDERLLGIVAPDRRDDHADWLRAAGLAGDIIGLPPDAAID